MAHAGFTTVGGTAGVYPDNPSAWNSTTTGYIGYTSNGTLTVDVGSDLLSNDGYIGYKSGTTGLVTISGTGSTWCSDGRLLVGGSGTGTLCISNGGSASSRYGVRIGASINSTGSVSVSGAGSVLTNSNSNVWIGPGSGTLSVTNGGTVTNNIAYIGYSSDDSRGCVTVSGAGSRWINNGELMVGSSGNGMLTVSDGGRVSNTDGYIGGSRNAAGSVTVSGSGSKWQSSRGIYVGDFGEGTMTVSDGGQVSNGGWNSWIGHYSNSTGSVTVSGAGSTWDNGLSLSIGGYGAGTLKITNGARVTCYNGNIGYGSTSTGTVTVSGAGSAWNNTSSLMALSVGFDGNGTLNITNGGSVTSSCGYIGFGSGSTGSVTVSGVGSVWNNFGSAYPLAVGLNGNGTLNIANGGSVSAPGGTYVGYKDTSSGTVNFGPGGGTLTTSSLNASPSQLTGVGTINANGLVSDVNLSFDSTASLKQTISLCSLPAQNIAIHLDMSIAGNNGLLGAGYLGTGSLSVRNGVSVISAEGRLGFMAGSTGLATVSGSGSTWANNGSLTVGGSGTATLSVYGGGAVEASNVSINNMSLLAIDVGCNSSLTVGGGAGTITNEGTICVLAGVGVPTGPASTPISSGDWEGSGTYQGIGGTLDMSSHLFTASAVTAGTAGTAVAFDRAEVQRLKFADDGEGGTGWVAGASFLRATTSSTATCTATILDDTVLGLLHQPNSPLRLERHNRRLFGQLDPARLSLVRHRPRHGVGRHRGLAIRWQCVERV